MHNYWVLFSGIVFLLVALYVLREQVTLRKRGIRTIGVVVDAQQVSDESGRSFRLIIQFTTTDGQQIRWKDSGSSSFGKNILGKPCPIIYDPRNPQHAIRDNWKDLALIAVFSILSIALLVFFIY